MNNVLLDRKIIGKAEKWVISRVPTIKNPYYNYVHETEPYLINGDTIRTNSFLCLSIDLLSSKEGRLGLSEANKTQVLSPSQLTDKDQNLTSWSLFKAGFTEIHVQYSISSSFN